MRQMLRYILVLCLLCVPCFMGAQTKPKRDTSKDRSVVMAKKQTLAKQKSTTPVTVKNTQNIASAKMKNKAKKTPKAPVVSQTFFSVDRDSICFSYIGGSSSIVVSSSDEFEIDVNPESWGKLSRKGKVLTLTVDPNNAVKERNDYFEVASQGKYIKIKIHQDASPSYLDVSAKNISFGEYGGERKIFVTANNNWSVSLSPTSLGRISINDKGTFTVIINANKEMYERNGTLKIRSGDLEKSIEINIAASTQKINNAVSMSNSGSGLTNSYKNNSSDSKENYSNNSANRKYVNYSSYKTPWYKERFTLGLNLFNIDAYAHTASLGSGLQFRIGRYSDFLNFILGANYAYQTYYDNFDIQHLDNLKWSGICHQITASAGLNFNLFKTGKHSKFYIGCMGEYGLWEKECTDSQILTNAHTIAVIPRLGFASKHCDWGFYYKRYMKDKNILKRGVADCQDVDEHRIGLNVTWYF